MPKATFQHLFCRSRMLFLERIAGKRKDEFFYRLWMRKESFVKAVGVGLGLDISRVVSSSAPR
ncbi:MAG: 4'-phosphopantetheinyl transferase superfamily protein [Methylobacter tundripaludum]|nr:4'-phosphopantetheinyl transferase superfamily protein [Methylobacter tundripaludum]